MADDSQPDDTRPPDFSVLINGFGEMMQDAFGFGKGLPWLVDTLWKFTIGLLGIILRGGTELITMFAEGFQQILEQDNPAIGRLAQTILGAMFGSGVRAAIPGGIIDPGNLEDVAPAVGAAVLASVFGASLDGEAGALEPSTELAERFLGVITNFVTRGFVMDLAEEALPHWHLEFIHNLEHELIAGLGLGRISRQVLRPIVHTLIATPAEWKANLAYRPRLMPLEELVRLRTLGELTDDELDDIAGRQGWSSEAIEFHKLLHQKPADTSANGVLLDHGVIDDEQFVHDLILEGFTDDGARAKLDAHNLARLDPWLIKQADEWLTKYKDGLISKPVFLSSLASTQLPSDIQQLLVNIGGAHREGRRRMLSEGQLIAAWDNNILTQNDVFNGLSDMGYSDEDVNTIVLTHLAIGHHKAEIEDLKKQQAADRAAAKAQEKADRLAAQAKARQDAAAERARRAAQLAAERAQAKADAERRREFIADAARQRAALVDAAHQAGAIEADHAAALKAQIDADEKALLAQAASQAADSLASFHTEILALKRADREADTQQQLDDVDLALSTDATARKAGVGARLSTVDSLLAAKLAEIAAIFDERASVIDADLSASLAVVDTKMLPTRDERAADAAAKIAAADVERDRKLADIGDEFAARHASVVDELAGKVITDKVATKEHDRLTLAQQQAERLAQQSHDLTVERLHDAAQATESLSVASAEGAKVQLRADADKARKKLTADRLAAELAAKQAADAERLRLQAIDAQQGPLSSAAATKARAKIAAHDAALKRSETLEAAQLAHAEDSAKAAAARATGAVEAARERLSLLERTSTGREAAAAAALAQLHAFDADVEAKRRQLEAEIATHAGAPDVRTNPQ